MHHSAHGEVSTALAIEYIDCASLKPDPGNARRHSPAQLVRLQAAIREFGFTAPILVDDDRNVVAGHARLLAAQALGIKSIPCVRLDHLSAAQRRALAIADNRIAELAEWDPEALRAEFSALCELEFPVELTGFETAEIDVILETPTVGEGGCPDSADLVAEPDRTSPPVSRFGDCWSLDKHRLYCGDALAPDSYEGVLADRKAAMVVTDPPFNVPIHGHVSGLGKTRHPEFAMASGDMSKEAFTAFLKGAMNLMARFSRDGSIHFIFMDWRHIGELTTAGAEAYTELKSLCIWNKNNGGMGSLYRSKHELIFVYKNGTAPHQNNILLGKHGRYRTNVWDYAGVNTFGRTRDADLAAHPTVKPIALIADAIRDCSKRGDMILDPFAGSGTILLAAERTGRRAAAIELDPHYVDTAVRRWQQATGKTATLPNTGETFDCVAATRASEPASAARPSTSAETGDE